MQKLHRRNNRDRRYFLKLSQGTNGISFLDDLFLLFKLETCLREGNIFPCFLKWRSKANSLMAESHRSGSLALYLRVGAPRNQDPPFSTLPQSPKASPSKPCE